MFDYIYDNVTVVKVLSEKNFLVFQFDPYWGENEKSQPQQKTACIFGWLIGVPLKQSYDYFLKKTLLNIPVSMSNAYLFWIIDLWNN